MIEFDIERGMTPQMPSGVNPTHKITIKNGTDVSVFWYLQHLGNNNNPSDPYLDRRTVKRLHKEARELSVGDFTYLSYADGKDYHLHRLGRDKFTLKSLS